MSLVKMLALVMLLSLLDVSCFRTQTLSDYFNKPLYPVPAEFASGAGNTVAYTDETFPEQEKALLIMRRDLPQLKAGLMSNTHLVKERAIGLLLSAMIDEFGGAAKVGTYDDVILDCTPELITAIRSPEVEDSSMAVKTLAFMPTETPAAFTPALLEVMKANIQNGAAGEGLPRRSAAVQALMHSQSFNDLIASQIAQAIRTAPDKLNKQALLQGFGFPGANKSDIVGEAVVPLLYDSDSRIRESALSALPAVYKTKSSAKVQLQNYASSGKATDRDKMVVNNTMTYLERQ